MHTLNFIIICGTVVWGLIVNTIFLSSISTGRNVVISFIRSEKTKSGVEFSHRITKKWHYQENCMESGESPSAYYHAMREKPRKRI